MRNLIEYMYTRAKHSSRVLDSAPVPFFITLSILLIIDKLYSSVWRALIHLIHNSSAEQNMAAEKSGIKDSRAPISGRTIRRSIPRSATSRIRLINSRKFLVKNSPPDSIYRKRVWPTGCPPFRENEPARPALGQRFLTVRPRVI